MAKPRFFTKRVYLDNTFSRNTADSKTHWIGSSFRAFAVVRVSDSSVSLTLTPDATDSSIQGIPLKDGRWHNFTVMPNSAYFENSVAQPGQWMDVLISTEDELTSGNVGFTVTSRSIDWDGSSSPQSKVTVTSTAAEVLVADSDRIFASFQFKSGAGMVYVGSAAEISDPDYKNICHHIDAGDDFEFKGTGSLWMKSVAGDVVFSLMRGKQS